MTLLSCVMAFAEGHSSRQEGDVAQITIGSVTTYYGTLSDAISAVPDNGTVELLSDIEYSNSLTITVTKDFTLDMKGFSISNSNPNAGTTNYVKFVGDKNTTYRETLTIKNGIFPKSGNQKYPLHLNYIRNYNVVLEDVTVGEGTIAAIYSDYDSSPYAYNMTIQGTCNIPSIECAHKITLNNKSSDFTTSLRVTAVKDAIINNDPNKSFTFGSETKIRGGLTLNEEGNYAIQLNAWFSDAAWNANMTFLTNYCENHDPQYYGEAATETFNGTQTVSGMRITDQAPVVNYEAQIGETGYSTFVSALEAVQDNETIQLLQDVTLEGTLLFQGETYTLDLNGHTLAAGSNAIEVEGNTNLTIQGGTITSSRSSAIEANAWQNNIPTLTLDNVTVTCGGTGLKTDGNVDLSLTGTTACTVKLNTLANLSNFTLTNSAECTIYVMGRNSIYNSSYTRADCIRDNALINKLGAGNDWWQIRTGFILPDQVATYSSHISSYSYVLTNATVSCGSDDELDYYYLIVKEKPDVVATVNGTDYYILSEALNASSAEHPAVLSDNLTVSALSATQSHNCYLDLNGHTLTIPQVGNSGNSIINGSMHISGTGTINTGAPFYLVGSTDANATDYSVLEIGANVTVNYTGANYVLWVAENANNTAYGVRVNLAGTVNSTVSGAYINGNIQAVSAHAPIFNISGTLDAAITGIYAAGYGIWNITGTVKGNDGFGLGIKGGQLNMTAGKIYAGGDDHRVVGYNNGMYKSGAALQIESNNAYAGAMTINITGGELESNRGYAIYEYVAKSNDPTAVQTIAIANDSTAHKLDANNPVVYPLFQGGICISQSLAARGGFVSGGKWTKDISANIKTGENLSLLNNPDGDNPPYLYLVGVPAPAQAEDYAEKDASNNAVLTNSASQAAAESYSSDNVGENPDVITIKETNPVVVSENTDVVATEAAPVVEVKKVTVDNNAQLTVTEGATLMVGAGSVLLDTTATTGGLTVEAGATLVVDGLIYGSTENNFVIESQEGKSGIVLFSPETEFIKEDHPKATYRFTSKAFREGSKWVYQRFGVPTFDGHATIEWSNKPEGDFKSWVKKWDYVNDDWTDWTPFSGNQLEINNVPPFQGLMLASNNVKPGNTNPAMVYEFTGSLMGNSDANLHFYYGWNYYANSYTAPININEFIQTVKTSLGGSNDILATIYLYQDMGDDTYTWQAVNEFTAGSSTVVGFTPGVGPIYENVPSVINPMQAFLMRLNVEGEADQTIDYADNVYTPATVNTFNPAPARNRVTNNSMQISVFNANGNFDKVFFVENDNFSNDLDNGFDAYKYDGNKGVSLYAMSADKHMEILASNDVDGSFIGINAPEAGNYTLYFSGIQGMNYALIDMKNNTVISIEEGGQYNFYAEAGQNDYRFQLVAPARVPTAIENVGVNAELKGIYTITGQYLGEDINALPKGVYIINGAKVVK